MFGRKGNGHDGALSIPPDVAEDAKAREVLRVWIGSDGKQHAALIPDAWADSFTWGLLLVDIARHVANALAESTGVPAGKTLARIKQGFDAEMAHPTDTPTGSFPDKQKH
ncbi:MAG: DUF5076 domain-containing protein [Candidatus Eiseniibacteriota bacterium]